MQPRISFLIISALLLGGPSFARDPFHGRLDPYRAEQILSGIRFRSQLMGAEWIRILGEKRNETFSVKPGDTLWDISQNSFSNARLWPKLWQVNSELTNPHELAVGHVIKFDSQMTEDWDYISQLPVIKLQPHSDGAYTDLEEDRFVLTKLSQRYRPTLFMMKSSDEILGEITGSYQERTQFMEGDEIYLEMGAKDNVNVGDFFSILSEEKISSSSKTGRLMRLAGNVRVFAKEESKVRAIVIAVFHPIQRKDIIVNMVPPTSFTADANAADGVMPKVMGGENTDKLMFIQGDLVTLDLGAENGMKVGQIFRVLRDRDPITGSRSDVEPDFKGEIQIISVENEASLGYIVKNEEVIESGNILYPSQKFMERAKLSIQENRVIEIE